MRDIGEKTEAIILAELIKRDYAVSVPFGYNHRYDLVIDQNGSFSRIQCKTGWIKDGKIIFNAQSSNNYTNQRKGYHGDADVFLVFCPETDKVYWIQVEEVGASPYLRIEPTKNNQSKGVRWAKDYELA
jgi:hypothetical protein